MATPPVLVADYEVSLWNISNSGPNTSVTPTKAVGDFFVVLAASGEWGNSTDAITTPSGGGETYNAGPKTDGTTNNAEAYSWYGTATTASAPFTLTMQTAGGSPFWGFDYVRFSGSDGIGAVTANNQYGTGAPSLDITTTYANSGVLAFFADWNVSTIASITWLSINSYTPATDLAGGQVVAARENYHGTYLAAFWPDVGAPGVKTTGLTVPSGTKWAGLALEIRGSAGAVGIPAASQFFPFFD